MTIRATGKLSSKNQIVLPRKAREALRLQAGDVVEFVINERDQRVYLQGNMQTRTEQYFGAARGALSDKDIDVWLDKIRREWDSPALPPRYGDAKRSR
jgi:AbrB family looped-hinge helix DNA binding protein